LLSSSPPSPGSQPPKPLPWRYALSPIQPTVPGSFCQLLFFEVAEHRRTLIVYPDSCGKTRLNLLVAQLVQFFFEEIRLLGHFDALEAAAQGGDADKI